MGEIWRNIVDYEDSYQVSNLGNVRSLDRVVISNIKGVPYKKLVKGRLLSLINNGIGYLQVGLKGGIKRYVHVLVAESFVEKPDNVNFYEVNHIDHDKSNNNYSNLEWVSKKENHKKRVDFYGTKVFRCINCDEKIFSNKAKRCVKCSNINLRKVKDRPTKEYILNLLKTNSYKAIGRLYNVSDNTIRYWLK